MKVGIVTEWFERGSAYVSREISNQLSSQGIECAIYARNEATFLNQAIWPGANVTEGIETKLLFGKAIDRQDFERWLETQEITHVIFNEQIWIAPVFWARELGVKTIGYVDYYRKKTVKHFKVYDALICNTKRHYSVFSWHRNSWYIPWGTDLNRFKPTPKKQDTHLTFIHSGGWSPYRKGTDLAIEAFSKLFDINARLIIHLQIPLEDFLAEFPELEQTLETDSRIRIITEPIKPEDFFSLGQVYLYPTRLEGIGLTQVEALACGIPIIVPNDGPMNEFVLDPISKTTPVSRYWERADSYYWPMNEVSSEALISNLQWFSTNFDSSESWTGQVRLVAEEYLDAKLNMAKLGFLLKGMESSTRKYRIVKIQTFSTKILIITSPGLFRLSQIIRKFI